MLLIRSLITLDKIELIIPGDYALPDENDSIFTGKIKYL